MGKRKRTDDAQASETPSTKEPATETKLSAAERRQQRSERKSKKPKSSKADDLPEQLLPGANVADDSFAGGEDFVSLDPAVPFTNAPAKSATKPKRKEAKPKSATTAAVTGEEAQDGIDSHTKEKKPKESSARFIVFVGNLPYSTTTPQIAQHFKKLAPAHIRHNTDKSTGKSKGFAFLEFDDYSAMKTCLKVYHHSNFDPERTARLPESAFDENGLEIGSKDTDRKTGRKINVELTAGGGGKGSGRKEKIQKKNTKLFEERERRKKEEIKKTFKERQAKKGKSEANMTEIGSEAVHPSRMNRVPNAED